MSYEMIPLNPQTIAVAGGNVAMEGFEDIEDAMLGMILMVTGQNETNEATLAEILAGLGVINIKRGGSNIISWDADRLHTYNSIKHRGQPILLGGADDDNFRRLGLWVPFSHTWPGIELYDKMNGLKKKEAGLALSIAAGTDVVAGSDNRVIDVAVLVDPERDPARFLGHLPNAKTMADGEYKPVSLPLKSDESLFDVMLYHTTNIDDGVVAETTTIEEFRVLRGQKEEILHSIRAEHMLIHHIDGDVGDDILYHRFEPPLPLDVQTKLDPLGGDANAAEIIPGILYTNE